MDPAGCQRQAHNRWWNKVRYGCGGVLELDTFGRLSRVQSQGAREGIRVLTLSRMQLDVAGLHLPGRHFEDLTVAGPCSTNGVTLLAACNAHPPITPNV